MLPDGRVAYRIKNPRRPNQTHRLMTPIEFLAGLAALVPPPRFALIRFHGAFAPNSKRRVLVVPERSIGRKDVDAGHAHRHPPSRAGTEAIERDEPAGDRCSSRGSLAIVPTPRPSKPLAGAWQGPVAVASSPEPSAPIEPSRIDWATLLRRVYGVDSLACPCGGRLELLELVTDATEICAALDRLDLDDERPSIHDVGSARGPPPAPP